MCLTPRPQDHPSGGASPAFDAMLGGKLAGQSPGALCLEKDARLGKGL